MYGKAAGLAQDLMKARAEENYKVFGTHGRKCAGPRARLGLKDLPTGILDETLWVNCVGSLELLRWLLVGQNPRCGPFRIPMMSTHPEQWT